MNPAAPKPAKKVVGRAHGEDKIRVKVVSKNGVNRAHFMELPNRHPELRFVFDLQTPDYDWFVVYDDLPSRHSERLTLGSETLACPPENTILLTYEPSAVKFYGEDYVNQFAHVLTSQEPEMLPHAGRRDAPPVGVWKYGEVEDVFKHPAPPEKSAQVCVFPSNKRMRHTLCRKRFDFYNSLTELLPGLGIYGKDFRPVEKKAECLDRYRYHIAVENHIAPHHWTEKLSDSFLGYCLPFYVGCPNAADYFPEESFIGLDIEDPRGAADTIREAIAGNEYEKRLPAIIEARRRVIEDYNLANFIGDTISAVTGGSHAARRANSSRPPRVLSRHLIMRRRPAALLRYLLGKLRSRRRSSRRYNSKRWLNDGL